MPAGEPPAAEAPVLRIAVDAPLRTAFDYLAPPEEVPPAGSRVEVPFGPRRRVGVVLGTAAASTVEARRLRRVTRVLEPALLRPADLELCEWASDYYHHPLGEVVFSALPAELRHPVVVPPVEGLLHRPGPALPAPGPRSPRRNAIHAALHAAPEGLDADALAAVGLPPAERRRWLDRGWLLACAPAEAPWRVAAGPPATAAQTLAIEAVTAALGGYAAFLLEGVTGSGKTEVYLRLVAACLARGLQVLLLVPEIGLSGQLRAILSERVEAPVAWLHSGLGEVERRASWFAARDGRAAVVLGTRSAVWAPLARPGLIIVDEEHDPSFKQQEGFRYSARDVAVMRARRLGVPVLLGSATPALESVMNVRRGRYRPLLLPLRVNRRPVPSLEVLDMRQRPLAAGLSLPLLDAVAEECAGGGQALLFLNRRGWAPVLLCHACGWSAECTRCSARLTWHAREERLRCHHCDARAPRPDSCPACGGDELVCAGQGTERLEAVLEARFPGLAVLRIDSDATRRRGSLEAALARARAGEAAILVGTQMLTKGHHFPALGMVGIVDADGALYGSDFRATERLAQTVVQVAGRCGRGERPGRVLLQTHHPAHPLLGQLVSGGYAAFVTAALAERADAGFPPHGVLALLRAEAPARAAPEAFLQACAELCRAGGGEVAVLGPVPAPLQRRAGRERSQLLLQATERAPLHGLLRRVLPDIEALPEARAVRWSVDVDPLDLS